MEADWSVEIGPGLPWIDAGWPGFLNLRTSPRAIDTLPEPTRHVALRDALLALNAPASHLFTSKCDAWSVAAGEIDPDEFSATPQHALTGFASYIDILDSNPAGFSSFALTEQRARDLTTRLRSLDIRCSRVDLVVRRATAKAAIPTTTDGYGITLYVAASGADHASAYTAWQTALSAVVAATIAVAESTVGE